MNFKDEIKAIAETRLAWFMAGLFVSGHNAADIMVAVKTIAGF